MPRIVVFQGSPRAKNNCPDQDGKTKFLLKKAISGLPDGVDIDYVDLSIEDDDAIVRYCKGCYSTAGGYHCHWPCDCYGPKSASADIPDLMHDQDIYGKLEKADGFVVFTPINWYYSSGQVKVMFDRLVCASLTLTYEQSEELGIGKDSEISRSYEKDGRFDNLLKNHLEGKFGAFFIHGDDGADDYKGRKLPLSYRLHEDEMEELVDPKHSVDGLVATCRYMGIFVPEDLVVAFHMNRELDYAVGNDRARRSERLVEKMQETILKLADYIEAGEPA